MDSLFCANSQLIVAVVRIYKPLLMLWFESNPAPSLQFLLLYSDAMSEASNDARCTSGEDRGWVNKKHDLGFFTVFSKAVNDFITPLKTRS